VKLWFSQLSLLSKYVFLNYSYFRYC
jgi:hypothetical protein